MKIYLVKEIVKEYRFDHEEMGPVLYTTKTRDIVACNTKSFAEKKALEHAEYKAKCYLESENKVDGFRRVNCIGYNKAWLYDHEGMHYLDICYETKNDLSFYVKVSEIELKIES